MNLGYNLKNGGIMDTTSDNTKIKWYLKPVPVVIAILMAGPFAAPLVWVSPAFKKWQKIVITILLALLTIWMVQIFVSAYKAILTSMQQLSATFK